MTDNQVVLALLVLWLVGASAFCVLMGLIISASHEDDQ